MYDALALVRMVDQAPGDVVVLSKDQIRNVLAELDKGNSARRLIVNLRSLIGAAQVDAA